MIDYYDHIDDYVNELLQGEELLAFEAAMAEDKELVDAVGNHDVAMGVIGSLIENEVRGVIGEVEGEEQKSNFAQESDVHDGKKGKVRWMRIMRNVAAACVVGVLGYWGLGEYQYNQLELEIFAQIPFLQVPTSKGGDQENTLDSIYYYYSTDQYERALRMLSENDKTIQSLSEKDIKTLNLVDIYSYFHLEQYQKALDKLLLLDPMKEDEQELLYHTYILLDHKEKARVLLSKLPLERANEIRHLSD